MSEHYRSFLRAIEQSPSAPKKTKCPEPTDTEMLEFVGLYVTCIASLAGESGHAIELSFEDEEIGVDETVVRRAKTDLLAFRKAVKAAMRI